MKKYFGFVAISVFLFYCANTDRDNPYDMWGSNYMGNASAEGSSSSVEAGEPSSSSGDEELSSSSAGVSSSVETDNYPSSSSEKSPASSNSVELSSSSAEPSSSSIAPSSSSVVPSSSSVLPSSSSTAPSSSSVRLSSSSSRLSSSSTAPSSSSVRLSSSSVRSSSSLSYSGRGNNIGNYRTVVIGTQTWMAENLDYFVEGSKCNNNNPSSCSIYGYLYNWATAMSLPSSCNSSSCSSQIQSPHRGICPLGWHLPNQAEWNTLSSYVQSNSGCSSCDAAKLKAKSGWNNDGNGTDDYEFSALPGGGGYSSGSFYGVGSNGYWWSASERKDLSGSAYSRLMDSNNGLLGSYDKSYLFSVRCLKD